MDVFAPDLGKATTRKDACPACGLPCDWRGLCPRCAIAGVLAGLAVVAGPEPAQRLGSYRLLDSLGSGGMGRVWRARQDGLDRDIALKTLRAGTLADHHARERFRREAQAAARLRHPGIVPVYEVGEANGEVFFTMEWVRGETLAQRLRSGPLLPRAAAALVRSLADAVHYAHAHGVIHRDLKPSNVLLDQEREDAPRLTDFGVALLTDNSGETLTATLEGLGTLAYLAPEQALGKHSPQGTPTDVYGLGAVLYHCLTGRPPFLGQHPAAVLRAVAESSPPAPSTVNSAVPRDLETVCLKCLEHDPARRYGSAAELRDELDRFLRDEPVRTRPISVATRIWRNARRRPAVVALAGLAALLALSLTLALNRSKPTETSPAPPATPLAALLTNWPVRPPELLGSSPLKGGGCSALLTSPCGRWVAAGDQVGAVRVFRAENFATQAALQLDGTIRVMDWSRDGNWLLVGTQTGHWSLWQPTQSDGPNATHPLAGMVNAAALSPGADRFFLGYSTVGELWQNEGPAPSRIRSDTLPSEALGATFNSTGERLLIVCGGNQFWLCEAATGRPIRLLRSETSLAARFTPDGRQLAIIRDGEPPETLTQVLEFFRTDDGAPTGQRIKADRGITSFCFSPDGGRVFAVNRQFRVEVFDAVTGDLIASPIQLHATVYRFGFSPDGLRLFTNTADERSQLWDAESGALLVGPVMSPWLSWATCLSSDGAAIIRPDAISQISFWSAKPMLPAGWTNESELGAALRRIGTPFALRLAAAFRPEDASVLEELAKLAGRRGTSANRSEERFLKQRAASLSGRH